MFSSSDFDPQMLKSCLSSVIQLMRTHHGDEDIQYHGLSTLLCYSYSYLREPLLMVMCQLFLDLDFPALLFTALTSHTTERIQVLVCKIVCAFFELNPCYPSPVDGLKSALLSALAAVGIPALLSRACLELFPNSDSVAETVCDALSRFISQRRQVTATELSSDIMSCGGLDCILHVFRKCDDELACTHAASLLEQFCSKNVLHARLAESGVLEALRHVLTAPGCTSTSAEFLEPACEALICLLRTHACAQRLRALGYRAVISNVISDVEGNCCDIDDFECSQIALKLLGKLERRL
jgi:hypothetical protein